MACDYHRMNNSMKHTQKIKECAVEQRERKREKEKEREVERER